jgi:hypothetical protein
MPDVRPGSLLLCPEIASLLLIHFLHMFDGLRRGRGSLLVLERDRHCLLLALLQLWLLDLLNLWLLGLSLMLRRGWDGVQHVLQETGETQYEPHYEWDHEQKVPD